MDDEARDQLERMALGASSDPIELPLSLLEAITKKFSDDHIIGSGGFANVYKGILPNGTLVAVKKLFDTPAMDEENFTKEVRCLVKNRHKNLVRFLGYYADKRLKVAHYKGEMVMAGVRQWLLCFEFLPKGSLDRYINDAAQGYEWSRWYNIIKGICEGLHYLHQNNIVHLDLKPANILLNCNMVPKIADFGVSRCFDEKQSRAMTSHVVGTLGYMAPEYIHHGQITFKSDIYSLGAIIMQILTGQKVYCAVEKVLENWSNRFGTSQTGRELGHVKVCAEIGNKCLDADPNERPAIECIIKELEEMESKIDPMGIDVCTSSATLQASKAFTELQRITAEFEWTGLLSGSYRRRSLGSTKISKLMEVHPLELCFPFKPNILIHCPVNLTNRTDKYVGVRISQASGRSNTSPNLYLPSFEMMEPNSSLSIPITMKQPKPPSWKIGKLKVWMIVMSSRQHLEQFKEYFVTRNNLKMTGGVLKDLENMGLGAEAYRARLMVVICDPASCQPVIHKKKFIPTGKFVPGNLSCIDVHPRETWILVGCELGFACIWNYKTEERVMVWQQVTSRTPSVLDLYKQGARTGSSVTATITSARFFVREHWCATGDDEGWVHVYAYPAKDKIKEFEAHLGKPVDTLAVHPTYPYLVTSSSKDTSIKIWDWGQGWICTRIYKNEDKVSLLKWNPSDNSTLISASYYSIKVWDIHFSDPITALDTKKPRDTACYLYTATGKKPRETVCYLYTATGHQHLMALAFKNNMDIWDLQRKECVHKISLQFYMYILDIACHPTLPVLFVIASTWGSAQDAYIYLWDVRTYRVEKIVQLTEIPRGKLFVSETEDLTRLIAICRDGISIVEINL